MEKVKLPTENAQEPEEEAKQPVNAKTMSPYAKGNKNNLNVSFAVAADSTDKPISQSSSLSQPALGLTQKQRLQWLQKRRSPGLWVQCDDCDRWRHLPFVIDSHELPTKWYCKMNPDSSLASCSAPEMAIRLRDEEDLIHSSYSAGSVVWARLPGWPWWPAMVDDCPDTEQFYWLDGFSDIPTHYNVVFFDTNDVTRAWIAPDQLKPFSANRKSFKHLLEERKFKSRLEVAMRQAEDADLLPLADRLGKYSFVARYKGTINKPKTNKKVLEKFKKQIKKLGIEFSDESSDDSDDFIEPREPSNKKANKNGNVIILGTPKRNKRSIIVPKVLNDVYNTKEQTNEEQNLTEIIETMETQENSENPVVVNEQQNKNYVEPDSMTVQIGSSEIVHDVKNNSGVLENAGTVTMPALGAQKETVDSQQTVQYSNKVRTVSSCSDDFDF